MSRDALLIREMRRRHHIDGYIQIKAQSKKVRHAEASQNIWVELKAQRLEIRKGKEEEFWWSEKGRVEDEGRGERSEVYFLRTSIDGKVLKRFEQRITKTGLTFNRTTLALL